MIPPAPHYEPESERVKRIRKRGDLRVAVWLGFGIGLAVGASNRFSWWEVASLIVVVLLVCVGVTVAEFLLMPPAPVHREEGKG